MAPICGSDCAFSAFVPLYSLTPCCRVLIAGVALLSTLLALVVFVYNWHTMMVEYLMVLQRGNSLRFDCNQVIDYNNISGIYLVIYLSISFYIHLSISFSISSFISIDLYFILTRSTSNCIVQSPQHILLLSFCTSPTCFSCPLPLTTSLFHTLSLSISCTCISVISFSSTIYILYNLSHRDFSLFFCLLFYHCRDAAFIAALTTPPLASWAR